MLNEYIQAAMQKATYELLEDGEGFFGSIPGFQGLWANAATQEACQQELGESLEEWILFGLKLGHSLPVVDGFSLDFTKEDVA